MSAASDYPLPSPDASHHVDADGNPAYAIRFKNVGKFHPPGPLLGMTAGGIISGWMVSPPTRSVLRKSGVTIAYAQRPRLKAVGPTSRQTGRWHILRVTHGWVTSRRAHASFKQGTASCT